MNTVRTAVSLVGALLLGGGYFASQYAYFFGNPASYSKAIESSSIPLVSMLVLLAVVLLGFVPEKGDAE